MEQKEIIDKFYVRGTTTLRAILQSLANLSSDKLNQFIEHQFPLKGETGLYKLLNSSDPVTSTFLNQKVDLNKLKEYLENQGLPFSFREIDKGNHTEKGVNLYFKVKDQELAKKALEKVFTDATTQPGEFAKKVVRKPNSEDFSEKLTRAEKSMATIDATEAITKSKNK